MSSNKPFRFGPVAMANAAADILNPGTTTGGVNCTAAPNDKLFVKLTHISIVNKTAGAITFSLYLGATGGSAAGTEVIGTAKSVAANDTFNWYGSLVIDTTKFLSGLASAATSLTIQGDGEIGVA